MRNAHAAHVDAFRNRPSAERELSTARFVVSLHPDELNSETGVATREPRVTLRVALRLTARRRRRRRDRVPEIDSRERGGAGRGGTYRSVQQRADRSIDCRHVVSIIFNRSHTRTGPRSPAEIELSRGGSLNARRSLVAVAAVVFPQRLIEFKYFGSIDLSGRVVKVALCRGADSEKLRRLNRFRFLPCEP